LGNKVKFTDLIDEDVLAQGQKIGVVKDVYIDSEKWEITHFEIQLTKEAAYEILGAKTPIRNSLAISALRKGTACCSDNGVEIKLSKAQLHIYLRPPE
jgi:sporulation protein YlmC with PRC-barrel domain